MARPDQLRRLGTGWWPWSNCCPGCWRAAAAAATPSLAHFQYYVPRDLTERAPERTLRMTTLARFDQRPTLRRLSHVVRRPGGSGLDRTVPVPAGPARHQRAAHRRRLEQGDGERAPGHVATVRENVIDALTAEQVTQLTAIAGAILARLDPDGDMTASYHRLDRDTSAESES